MDKPTEAEIREAAAVLEKKTGKPAAFWIPLLAENPFENFDQAVASFLSPAQGKKDPAFT